MKYVTSWVRTCSTPWRRTTVWVDSVVVPCAPSPSTSSTIMDKRSSPSPGLWSACPAASLVVCKRWVKLFDTLILYFRDSQSQDQGPIGVLCSRNHFLVLPVWVCVYNISKSLLLSWRCSLPPVTQWGTLYNSGTRSPLNSSSQMNTLSLYWRSMGPSVDGAASQMLTLRWVYPNTEIH